ncbi:MAG: hypothetical protein K6G84_08750 [Lachnospiraceae bacterium]|nr:hypothetical protein [Lachnospiraceae bacterium]
MRGKKIVSVLLIVLALLITGFNVPENHDTSASTDLPSAMSDNKMHDKDDDQYDPEEPEESEESEKGDDSEQDSDSDSDKDEHEKDEPEKDDSKENDSEEDDSEEDDDWEDDDDEDIPLIKMTDYSGIITTNAVLVCGNKYALSANFIPQKYMVSDKKVVKVSRDGEVRPKKEGTAMIVAVGDEGESASYFVKVEKPKMRQKTVLNGSISDIMDMVDDYYEAYPSEIIIDDLSVARVDTDTGDLFALKKGKTKVTLMFGMRKLRKVLKVK